MLTACNVFGGLDELPARPGDTGGTQEDGGDDGSGDVSADRAGFDVVDVADVAEPDARDGPASRCVSPDDGWQSYCTLWGDDDSVRTGAVLEVPVDGTSTRFRRVTAGEFVAGMPASPAGYDAFCAPQSQPPGASWEGCIASCERERHVRLTHDFWMMETELRVADWLGTERFVPEELIEGCSDPDCPMRSLNWWVAAAYANRFSCRNGRTPCYAMRGCSGPRLFPGWKCEEVRMLDPTLCDGYRLPSEVEWEFAARGASCSPHYDTTLRCAVPTDCEGARVEGHGLLAWSECNSAVDEIRVPHPVRSAGVDGAPNSWGLYDMYGNVAEWTTDWLTEIPAGSGLAANPVSCTPENPELAYRVARGGSFRDHPNWLRSSARTIGRSERQDHRDRLGPDEEDQAVGFRLVRTVDPTPSTCGVGDSICCLTAPSTCSAPACE